MVTVPIRVMSTVAPDFLREKTVLVFGAGYIGGAVSAQARAVGASVTALTRNPTRAAELASQGIRAVCADLADVTAWADRVPPAPDFVLNAVSGGGAGVAGYRHSYVDGAHALLAWAGGRAAPGALIYTSSTSVYPQDGGVAIDETAPTPPRDERAAALREAEELLLRWPGAVTVLRLAGIYGPGRHHLLDQLRAGESAVAGIGTHRLNLIHRDDVVSAIFAAWAQPERAQGRVFNLADDGPAPKAEVVAWLAQRLGRPVPSFTGQPAGGRRAVVPDRQILNRTIKSALGWAPRYPTYREGFGAILAE